jgi:hypothetical protein
MDIKAGIVQYTFKYRKYKRLDRGRVFGGDYFLVHIARKQVEVKGVKATAVRYACPAKTIVAL